LAWGGKISTRMTPQQRQHFFKTSNRSLPPVDNPHGIPRAVLNQLASENIADKQTYTQRLNELLAERKTGG